ncbi:HAD family hydrolase [Pullulanibacillus sp. KACC 23026]|uniref:HAD family hydrolase n=1 Tax=Pullulanibacillus sp. KACC 23026 TaxID=3028315 RepID=UPI0023AFA712|nr:HAD family hydrolase [Pullulanibacillus sp. KACC 23026]WEG13004.1 HAD family hydrolase [Pullulanibacillus sp. KACC 23026]
MDLSNTEVIVFDLDGTLYEDTHHFDYYAERLTEKLSPDVLSNYKKDYELAKQDQHTLKMGRVYDAVNDLILVQLDNRVQEAFTWEGEPLSSDELQERYPEPITLDQVRFVNVGDLWWVPVSVALHYGLDPQKGQASFLETREYMMGPDYEMDPIPGFKEVLEALHGKKKLVLLTNSPEADSEVILQKLGLDKVFHLKLFNGSKPVRTLERFETVKETFNVEYSNILSIGDNWLNEIRPVQPLGCSTIYIDHHNLGSPDSADLVVSSMTEALPFLKKLV